MENLIYLLVVIAYFIYQAQLGRKKAKEQREQREQRGGQEDIPGRKVREVRPETMEEKMKEIFREVEMKQKPYARPETIRKKKPVDVQVQSPAQQPKTEIAPKQVKKSPSPFLNFDMTTEEVAPEGTWTAMGEERFSKIGYDYNKSEVQQVKSKISLRDAMVGKIILERPDW